jgi:integrase
MASLRAFFSDRLVSSIQSRDVVDYHDWRANTHKVRDVTIRHDMHNLSKFMKFAIKRGWRPDNPVHAEDIPSDADAVRLNPLTPIQQRAYMKAAANFRDLYDLTRLMINQGCRPEELLCVEKNHVDLYRRYLHIVGGKSTAAKRTLRLSPLSRSR